MLLAAQAPIRGGRLSSNVRRYKEIYLMPRGAFRQVFLAGHFAIKVPRLRNFRAGLISNRWERETWCKWRRLFGWENLCPVLAADPFGLVVVMQRAQQPVSVAEAIEAAGDYYPDIDCEYKPENFGRLQSGVVILDYGIPCADSVRRRREYLSSFAKRAG